MFSRARGYFSNGPPGVTAAAPTPPSIYRAASTTASSSGPSSSGSYSPASQALAANNGARNRPPGIYGISPYTTPAYNATQLQSRASPHTSPPIHGDPRQSTHTAPRQRKSSMTPNPYVPAGSSPYGTGPHRTYAVSSQQSFSSYESPKKTEKLFSRKRTKSDAAVPMPMPMPKPAPYLYAEPAYRATQMFPMASLGASGSPSYTAVPTPSSMRRSTSAWNGSMQSLNMAVYNPQQHGHAPIHPSREVFTPDPPRQPNVLRRRRTVSSDMLQPPPLHVHQVPIEHASYEPSHTHQVQRQKSRPSVLPAVKFKCKGVPIGGLLLSEAISGVRMSRKDRYPVREMHADRDMNILVKVAWPGCRSLTYAISVNARDGRVDLTTLARRIARACHHFLDARQVAVHREHVRLHRIEEFSTGHWQVVLSAP